MLLEEPELSLHTSIVRQLPAVFSRVRAAGGRQVLLTTHSNEILEDPGLGVDEAVVLVPGREGTEAVPAGEIPDVRQLLEEAGLSLAEILSPRTRPDSADELPDRIGRP